ncbi:RelA/SpoT [Clostridium botulinum]
MDQKDFIQQFKTDKHIYTAWGEYVKNKILELLKNKVDVEQFLKLDVNVRVKSVDSLLEKAFYRNKNYTDPYNEITDKVGIRFIVLYLDDIEVIEHIVESISEWNYSKDRDFSNEIEKNPEKFGYESCHYVVTNNSEIAYNKVTIPKGIACEIQIRTLLQHAYCEMSHSTVYKRKVHNTVKRITARSMALIESADYFFKEVKGMVYNEEKSYIDLLPKLTEYYSTFAKVTLDDKINMFIIDNYKELLNQSTFSEIKKYIESKPFLKEKICKNYNIKLIYRQPIVLLMYYLISQKRTLVYEKWPLTEDELIPLYNDLGISLN